MAIFPGRTFSSVRTMAYNIGLRRGCKRRDWRKITAEHKPAFNFMTGAIR